MKLYKIHGLGNDFVFLDYQEGIDYSSLAIKLCNRKLSIGGDGLIIVKQKPSLEMIYYNADGSRAPMCGNGIRCFALYCYNRGIKKESRYDVNTLAGTMKINVVSFNPFLVEVDMGRALFDNELLHIDNQDKIINQKLIIDGVEVIYSSVFVGTIHTMIFVRSFDDEVVSIAEKIHAHPTFKKKTNVNFVKVISKDEIEVRTYERGCGWTLACGTGCSASAYIANYLGLVNEEVKVDLEYGSLKIAIKDNIYMTGPAEEVFSVEMKGI